MRTASDRATAITLMRMALVLIEREGDLLTAARLQHAIDTASGAGPVRSEDDVPTATLDRLLG